MNNKLSLLALLLLFVFSLLSIKSSISSKGHEVRFSFQNSGTCDFSLMKERILGGVQNVAHIKGFFVMSLLGLFGFRYRNFFYTGIFVSILTVITEALQMWAPSRHCRLTDVIPNAIGFALACLIFAGASRLKTFFSKLRIKRLEAE